MVTQQTGGVVEVGPDLPLDVILPVARCRGDALPFCSLGNVCQNVNDGLKSARIAEPTRSC
jgi:hypothetical protein